MELLREHSVPAAQTISRQRSYPCWLVMRNRLWWHPGNWRDANLAVDLGLVRSSRRRGGRRDYKWARRGEMPELDVDSCRVSSLLHLDVCWYFFSPYVCQSAGSPCCYFSRSFTLSRRGGNGWRDANETEHMVSWWSFSFFFQSRTFDLPFLPSRPLSHFDKYLCAWPYQSLAALKINLRWKISRTIA